MKESPQPLTPAVTSNLRVAPELKSLFDWRVDGGEGSSADEGAPIIVRPDGRNLIIVSGLSTYIRQRNNAMVSVLMAEDATPDDYTPRERAELANGMSPPPLGSDLLAWINNSLPRQIPGAIESVWLFGSRANPSPKKNIETYTDADLLIFIKTGLMPSTPVLAQIKYEGRPPSDLFFHERGTSEVVHPGRGSFRFTPFAWHQLSDAYAEYSPSKAINWDKPQRARAFCVWSAPSES